MQRRSLAVLLALAASGAFAQDAEPSKLERVEVVGSHLRQLEQEGASPVLIYRRDDIEASGATRIGDFLQTLPIAGFDGLHDRNTAFSPFLGVSALSLRGLGPGATLVLLNGRRVAAYGIALDNDATFVDLNSLPLAAVERVEVLRDGASAIYGADAIGGVVNIVLRRDFQGAEAGLRLGAADNDSWRRYGSLSLGAGDLARDRYNAFIVIDALHQQATALTSREFSRSNDQRPRGGDDLRSPFSTPPTVRLSDSLPMPGVGCPPERIGVAIAGGGGGRGAACLFDFAPYTVLLPRVDRLGALGVGTFAATSSLKLFAEVAASRTRTFARLTPAPIDTQLAASLPTNPYGQNADIRWRPLDIGSRESETTINFGSAPVGAEGAWSGWDWTVATGASRVATDVGSGNFLGNSAALAALNAGSLNPFVESNDPALLATLRMNALDRYLGTTGFMQGKATTDLAQLAHGPLQFALGVEHRRDRFSTALDTLTLAGEIGATSGAVTSDSAGRRSVDAAFAELLWPLLPGVEAQFAARRDRDSDFGSATSPKVAIRWQPAKGLLLRASAGRGFLPPSLPQIHKPLLVEESPGYNDPIRCPATGSPDDCDFAGDRHSQQGNPELKPERSRQTSVGIVFEPLPGCSAGVDVWRIRHLDKIAFGADYIVQHEDLFPGRVVRAEPTPEDIVAGLPGLIVEVRDTYINLASREVRGADVELKGRWGALQLNGLASYLARFTDRISPATDPEDQAGLDGHPRWRASLGASWRRASWQVGVNARYIGHYVGIGPPRNTPRRIASWTAFDLHTGWSGARDDVNLGIVNLADRDPPFRDVALGYDSAVHDPLGRQWWLAWRHRF
jgi:iron complex outermembrane receptor protein